MKLLPAHTNLAGAWVLTFILAVGRIMGYVDIHWFWVVSPVILINSIFATRALLKGLLT